MKRIQRTVASSLKHQYSPSVVLLDKTLLLLSLAILALPYTHTALASTSIPIVNDKLAKPIQNAERAEPSAKQSPPHSSWLDFGGSLGFGATYIIAGPKIYIGTPYVRVFVLAGLGVGAGVDFKLGKKLELGLTRAVTLGGGGWDVVALRYHWNGSFKRGWFFGAEHIGNRTFARDLQPDGSERRWFATFGFDF